MATDGRRTVLGRVPRRGVLYPLSVVDTERDAPAPIWTETDHSLAASDDDDSDFESSDDDGDCSDDSDKENATVEAPEADAECPSMKRIRGELDARQAAAVGKCVNVETKRRMDGREAAWRAWCASKKLDADPTVAKVREYLLDEWVEVDPGKRRVSPEN